MDLAFFQQKIQTDDIVDNIIGEKNIFNKLIVVDDISGLADTRICKFFNCSTNI